MVLCLGPTSACGYFGYDDFGPIFPADSGLDASLPAEAGVDAAVDGGVDTGVDASVPIDRLEQLCAFTSATVILDGDPTDDAVGRRLGAALGAGCGSSVSTRELAEGTPGLLDPTTFAPRLGPGDLGLVGGDSYFQDVMVYLEMQSTPIVTVSTPTTWQITERASGAVLAEPALTDITPTHDVGVIQVATDAASGSVVLSAHGLYFGGTEAMAYYFETVVAPGIATDTHTFYVIEWTNLDADPAPSAGDTYVVLAAGP